MQRLLALSTPRIRRECMRTVATATRAKGKETSATILANALVDLDRLTQSSFVRAPVVPSFESNSEDPKKDDFAAALFPRTTASASGVSVRTNVAAKPANVSTAAALAKTSATSTHVAPDDAAHFLTERFDLISACLQTGDCKRAEVLFHRTVRIFRNSFVQNPSTPSDLGGGFTLERGMVNAFVEAYLAQEPQNYAKALEWHSLAKEYKLAPDVSTYAALIHHLLITENNL
ncbi:UNVERIFIED_CONTAM: hypothetical protein HDU68_005304, partial [Siphonaria sp. JEL0065]